MSGRIRLRRPQWRKDRDVGYTADSGEAGEGDCSLSSKFS